VMADPALIGQVLQQLVHNARDAMPEGGTLTLGTEMVEVNAAEAEAEEDARPGRFVSLSVADTGCGMSPEVQSKLFEPFFTTKDARKAAGLGLATVRGLVKQHAGWVQVESQPKAGTRVTIFFPRGQMPG